MKYIEFKDRGLYVSVLNKRYKSELGQISYYAAWKEHIFSPGNAYFSADCLIEIVRKLEALNRGE